MKPFLFLFFFTSFYSFSQSIQIDEEKDNPELTYGFLKNSNAKLFEENPILYYQQYNEHLEIEKKVKSLKSAKTSGLGNWLEIGPKNRGGRCRAVAWDPNEDKKVWAGSESGGLWYNNDITDTESSWQKVNDFWDRIPIASIAFDPTNTKIMYVATGCYHIGYIGSGIYKSVDAGKTFTRLISTVPTPFNSSTVTYAMSALNDIKVNSKGEVFVGSGRGVLKSADGGVSWQIILRPVQKIGGSFLAGNFNSNSEYIFDLDIAKDDILYASFENGQIFKSNDSNALVWTNISPPVNIKYQHTVVGLAKDSFGSNQLLYAYIFSGVGPGNFAVSKDAGNTWQVTENRSDIRSVQAWSNSVLAVSPSNSKQVYLGLEGFFVSSDGGITFKSVSTNSYADCHDISFNPKNAKEFVKVDDGGVGFFTETETSTGGTSRLKGLNVYQAYSGAFENTNNSTRIVSVAQDSPSTTFDSNSPTEPLSFGEGLYCEIDQDEPNIYIISEFAPVSFWVYDSKTKVKKRLNTLATNQGVSVFPLPATYDSKTNTLYAVLDSDPTANSTKLLIIRKVGTENIESTITIPIPAYCFSIAIAKSENTIFIGTEGLGLYKVANLDQKSPLVTKISPNFPGYLTSIDVGDTENNLIITLGSIAVKNVYYTNSPSTNASSWIEKDNSFYTNSSQNNNGTFGIPLLASANSVVSNPKNRKQVAIGTTMGVYVTQDITQANPNWQISDVNLAHTSISQLKIRNSDNAVLAVSYGRGNWMSFNLFQDKVVGATEISNFRAEISGSKIKINWDTKNESNLLQYLVERRIDNKNWEELGTLKSLNNLNSQAYQLFDVFPKIIQKVEYRLSYNDFNFNAKYHSDLTQINILGIEDIDLKALNAYPNPTSNKSVVLDGLTKNSLIVIFDINGRYYRHLNSKNEKEVINLSDLPSGVYIFQVSDTKNSKSIKIVVE